MLNIKRFMCNMLQENCYVVNDETKECVIIDCGAFWEEEKKAITQYINDNELVPKHLIVQKKIKMNFHYLKKWRKNNENIWRRTSC